MNRALLSITTLLCASLMASNAEISASSTMNMNADQASMPVCYQGDDWLPASATAGYNAPAGVTLKNDDGWLPDVYVDVSFIYYFAAQEGMGLATSGQLIPGTVSYGNALTSNTVFYNQSFEYTPGFKIGIGSNFYEWQVDGEYTWFRQSSTTSFTAQAPLPIVSGIGGLFQDDWFMQSNPVDGSTLSGTAISSMWKLAIDLADVAVGRPFYEGKNLTVAPFFGLRGAFIRQTVNLDLTTSTLLGANVPVVKSLNNSKSWGIGPRTGFGASCLLGMGVRLEGSAAVGALYTDYTYIKHSENTSLTSMPPATISARQTNYHTVRPEMDLGLGLSWGTYLDCQQYHVSLTAAYDFSVFWEQNMIRKFMDEVVAGIGAAAGTLYLHGLDITARFDF